MKVAVVGGRDFSDKELLYATLDKYQELEIIVTGDAKGADSLALAYAKEKGIPFEVFFADWTKNGRAAGPLRNKEIVSSGPQLVIAFWDGKSAGTRSTITLAEKAGTPVKIVTYTPEIKKKKSLSM